MDYAEEFPVVDEPDVPFEKKEVLKLALSVFMKLTPKQRSCVVLKDVMDYSLAEISEFLDGSVSEVKAALHRGRARLRELSALVQYDHQEATNTDDLELICATWIISTQATSMRSAPCWPKTCVSTLWDGHNAVEPRWASTSPDTPRWGTGDSRPASWRIARPFWPTTRRKNPTGPASSFF